MLMYGRHEDSSPDPSDESESSSDEPVQRWVGSDLMFQFDEDLQKESKRLKRMERLKKMLGKKHRKPVGRLRRSAPSELLTGTIESEHDLFCNARPFGSCPSSNRFDLSEMLHLVCPLDEAQPQMASSYDSEHIYENLPLPVIIHRFRQFEAVQQSDIATGETNQLDLVPPSSTVNTDMNVTAGITPVEQVLPRFGLVGNELLDTQPGSSNVHSILNVTGCPSGLQSNTTTPKKRSRVRFDLPYQPPSLSPP